MDLKDGVEQSSLYTIYEGRKKSKKKKTQKITNSYFS